MRAEQFITEGATPVLYHKTGINAALEILKSGEFKMSSVMGNKSESDLAPNGYPYYLSATRTKVGDYHRWVGSSAVMFVLDGAKIAQNYKVKPVDYWERSWQHSPDRTRESEDRIFGRSNTMPTDSITAIHVLLQEQDERHSEIVRQLLITAKTQGIQAYLYNDANAWRLQDTRKALSPSEAGDLLKGHRQEPPFMRRPNRGLGRGQDAYGRSSLLMWIELIMKQPGQPLSKGADKIRYDLQYYGDTSSRLKNDMFNAKKPDSPEYPLVVKLGDYMTKNNLDFAQLIDMLKSKWAKKNLDESFGVGNYKIDNVTFDIRKHAVERLEERHVPITTAREFLRRVAESTNELQQFEVGESFWVYSEGLDIAFGMRKLESGKIQWATSIIGAPKGDRNPTVSIYESLFFSRKNCNF